jgi:predicted extracellular nuclease
MAELRVATFNVENLFARWRFKADIDPAKANKRGWTVDETLFEELGVDAKTLTGMAVRELEADIVAFQEVENVDTLKHFRSQFLGGRGAYPYVAGIDGNDPRLIDVAVLSKLPIVHVRSFQHLMDPESPTTTLFSRDCLEVDIEVEPGTTLTLFVNHFKSMLGGRSQTRERRRRQAAEVIELVKARFGKAPGKERFIVLGDFNDYLEKDKQGESGIKELVEWDEVENVVARRPAEDRWTHFYAGGNDYRQLDYLLLSKSLAEANDGEPEIMRKGAPLRATRYDGERFPGVGEDNPKASDHCPVVLALSVGS